MFSIEDTVPSLVNTANEQIQKVVASVVEDAESYQKRIQEALQSKKKFQWDIQIQVYICIIIGIQLCIRQSTTTV